MNDILIIGGGPAAMLAAVYAVRQKLKTLVVAKILEAPLGPDAEYIKQKFAQTIKQSEFVEVIGKVSPLRLEKNVVSFSLELKSGKIVYARAVIITQELPDLEDLTSKDPLGKIKINELMQSSVPGVFAAGNAITTVKTDELLSAAEGARAAVSAGHFLGR